MQINIHTYLHIYTDIYIYRDINVCVCGLGTSDEHVGAVTLIARAVLSGLQPTTPNDQTIHVCSILVPFIQSPHPTILGRPSST